MNSLRSNPPIKVLLCANHLGKTPNGPAKFANLLIQNLHLIQHRLEVRILTSDQSPTAYGEKGLIYRTAPVSAGVLGGAYLQYRLSRAYRKKIFEIRQNGYAFDLLVFNELTPAMGLPRNLPFRVAGFINDSKNHRPRLAGQKNLFSWASRSVQGWLQRIASTRLDQLVLNSHYMAGLFAKAFSLPPERYSVMYKAVNMRTHTFRQQQISSGHPIKVLFAKTDYRIGGLADLFVALNTLDDYTFELTVAGPPVRAAETIFTRYGNPAEHLKVSFLGQLPPQRLFTRLQESDVFCVPSISESLGVANIEAMAHGVPVVATWVGGVPEVTDQGRAAYMSPPSDPVALAAAIRQCIENPELTKSKVLLAVEHIRKLFDVEQVLLNFSDICERTVTRDKNSGDADTGFEGVAKRKW